MLEIWVNKAEQDLSGAYGPGSSIMQAMALQDTTIYQVVRSIIPQVVTSVEELIY